MKYVGYITTFVAAVGVAVGLSIYSMGVLAEPQMQGPTPKIDQGSVCVAASDEQALDCPEGRLFMARLTINESDLQNSLVLENRVLNTMALYCDTNFEIQHTRTGVLCVLTHERIQTASQEDIASDTVEEDS